MQLSYSHDNRHTLHSTHTTVAVYTVHSEPNIRRCRATCRGRRAEQQHVILIGHGVALLSAEPRGNARDRDAPECTCTRRSGAALPPARAPCVPTARRRLFNGHTYPDEGPTSSEHSLKQLSTIYMQSQMRRTMLAVLSWSQITVL